GTLTGTNTTLTKTGSNKLTLSGTNNYEGATNINAGTLALTGNGSIAESSQVNVTGTFDISGITPSTSTSVQDLQGNGFVNLGTEELEVAKGTFGGQIIGTGTLTKTTADTLTLSNRNSYSGATNIKAGMLALIGYGNIVESSNVTVDNDAIFDISGITPSTSTRVQGLQGSGNVNLGNKELEVAKGTFGGVIAGAGTLTKTTADTLTLSGTNTYEGATNINAGKLALTGTIDETLEINVAEDATLDVQGAKTLNNLDSAGTVTFNNDLTLAQNKDTSITGLNGTGSVTKIGNSTTTTTLVDNTAGTFIQQNGSVKLTGTLTGNYEQKTGAGQFIADAGANTAIITKHATFVDTLELDKKLQVGSAQIVNLKLNDGSITATDGNLNVTGTYADTAGSTVDVRGEFQFANDLTINSRNFHANKLAIADGKTVTLQNASVETDTPFANNGTLIVTDGSIAAELHGTMAGHGTVWIGNESSKDIKGAQLNVTGDWTGEGHTVNFAVDDYGKVGTLTIDGNVTSAANTVNLNGQEINRNKLAKTVSDNPHDLITANTGANTDAFQLGTNNDLNNNTNSWKFLLNGNDNGDNTIWQLSAESEAVVPDVSSFFLTNIIGFDLPRAQNNNGPWVRTKGGSVNDDKAQLNETTYQLIQIGWDKSFDAVYGGNWFAGIFMEGNWMYGKGDYYRDRNTPELEPWLAGNLKSSHRGAGAGLYISRGFKNNMYIDILGRINTFDSRINMTGRNAYDDHPETASYNGKWTDSIFAFAIEVGTTFNSKNKRWTFAPYNRLLYYSTPSSNYLLQITGDDPQALSVRSHSASTWTNQLGGRLYLTSQWNGKDFGNLFIGGDYYQGLSGKFAVDVTSMGSDAWKPMTLSRPKNNLTYGIATIGATIFPTDRLRFSAQADFMFGEVSGSSVTFGGRYNY
ncbi:MAG: autotransporter-associated beta strand repeat-containing protein, partial [Planctomycetaceae bacterium]|nr:autotransporter-associated beta strand repeat-containing protein [Planctomycetaceae bacterium]